MFARSLLAPRGPATRALLRVPTRTLRSSAIVRSEAAAATVPPPSARGALSPHPPPPPEQAQSLTPSSGPDGATHAVISSFDMFTVGIGPSSSHTIGPLRAARIFVLDIEQLGLLDQVKTLKVTLYGSLAATGKGHHTPQALCFGFEGVDSEDLSLDVDTLPGRYRTIRETKTLVLGGRKRIAFDGEKDMLWKYGESLPQHPNGMRFSVFNDDGDLLATNTYFSVGGGFVVNERTQIDENLFYKSIDKRAVGPSRREQHLPSDAASASEIPRLPGSAAHPPVVQEREKKAEKEKEKEEGVPYPFHDGASLLALTKKHNLTIAQIVYENELHWYTPEEIRSRILKIWTVMDECIRSGVTSTETHLPGRLKVKRRARALYKRLQRGLYPALGAPAPAAQLPGVEAGSLVADGGAGGAGGMGIVGRFDHQVRPVPPRKTIFPALDFLSAYAIAVNETNAGGGRVVTAPTLGAAGVIPAVLKYITEFISEEPERDIMTFLLTASAIGMLYKRGATISAAEGGCMAEVGVACSMAAAGFAACMGGSPEVIEQAAEIGIEHNLGLTCDPIDGMVQVPCIERNSLGAVKAVTAAQLALAGDGTHSVSLDDAIRAMRVTAADMSTKYKETSLAGLATEVRIPVSVPEC